MNSIIWGVAGLLDTILKAFEYGWFIVVPIILAIIILIIIRKKIKKFSLVITILSILLFVLIFSSRIWGPTLYGFIIKPQIGNKENFIESQLEKKYNRDFTFVSKDDMVVEEDSGSGLGQDIDYDYSMIYRFKDEDGVIAIVRYKKDSGWDYYEVKRSKYDIEKSIYDYAEENGIKDEFYVIATTNFESIQSSKLNEKRHEQTITDDGFRKYRITDEMEQDTITFISTKKINDIEKLLSNITVQSYLSYFKHINIQEYVVTENEYKKVVDYYESEKVKNGLDGMDYEGKYEFNKNNVIDYKRYQI